MLIEGEPPEFPTQDLENIGHCRVSLGNTGVAHGCDAIVIERRSIGGGKSLEQVTEVDIGYCQGLRRSGDCPDGFRLPPQSPLRRHVVLKSTTKSPREWGIKI